MIGVDVILNEKMNKKVVEVVRINAEHGKIIVRQ